MKKILLFTAILLFFGFAFYGCRAAFSNNKKIEMLRQQKQELKAEVSALEDNIKVLQAENSDLQEEAESLQAENSALHEDAKSLRAENLDLQVKAESLQAEAPALPSPTDTTASVSATCWYFGKFFSIPVHDHLDLDNPNFYQLPHKYEDGKVRDLLLILDTSQVTQINLVSEIGSRTQLDFGQAGGMTQFYYYMPEGGDYIFEIITSSGKAYYIMVGYHN